MDHQKSRGDWLRILPSHVFVKNHPLRRYVEDITKALPSDMDIDHVVFVLMAPDVYRSPLTHILPDGRLGALGCGYCMGDNHKHDPKAGTLWVSGTLATPISHRVPSLLEFAAELDRYMFLCPYCSTLINRWAKKAGIVPDVDKVVPKEELARIMKELQSLK